MHYYQFNIADYRKDTTHLSRIEHSIYRDLIDWYYLDEAPIPLDLTTVSRRLRISSTDDERALKNVLTDFFERTTEGYVQSRIEHEIANYHHTIEIASKAGKASAEARRIKAIERALNDRSTNHKSITNNQSKPKESCAPATRLPSSWAPSDDDTRFLESERPDLSLRETADSFRDYWIGIPGTKGKKTDWPATWRNWVRRQESSSPINGKKTWQSQKEINDSATLKALGLSRQQSSFIDIIEGERA